MSLWVLFLQPYPKPLDYRLNRGNQSERNEEDDLKNEEETEQWRWEEITAVLKWLKRKQCILQQWLVN